MKATLDALTFVCDHCGAHNAGDEYEFHDRNTMPPSWTAVCAFCLGTNVTFPRPLVVRAARAAARKMGF